MADIALLAPYPELADLSRDVTRQLGIDAEVLLAPEVPTAVETARWLCRRNIQVIIARGVAAWAIRGSELQVPVIDLPVTGFDLLRGLGEARALGGPIGIAELPPIIRSAEAMEDYTGIPLIKYALPDYGHMQKGIEWLHQQGVRTVMGRIVASTLAAQYGMRAVTLTTSREAVAQALEEAHRVVQVRKAERARAEQLRTILDFSYEGIVAIDGQGIITVFNPVAERIMGVRRGQVVGRPAAEVIPNTRLPEVLHSGQAELEEIQDLDGVKIVTNRVPISVDGHIQGVVATFQEVKHLQSMEQNVRRKLASRGHVARYSFEDILGDSEAISAAIDRARRFAAVDSTVLILGETGTGKELFAHAIHRESRRRQGPFVAVNCAALPENLLESELFGYAEGAFTGARKGGKAGLFELAHGGTIYLDEIPEMTARLQSELLRVLEQHEVTRLGDDKVIPVDVRVIASSNQDLATLVARQAFRQDLYYRLNVLRFELPPLRDRGEDISLLAEAFLAEFTQRYCGRPATLAPDAKRLLCARSWPGNVRQLRNAMERVAVACTKPVVDAQALASILDTPDHAPAPSSPVPSSPVPSSPVPLGLPDTPLVLEEWEREAIRRALAQSGGNKNEAARILGIGRTTLWRKLKAMHRTSGA